MTGADLDLVVRARRAVLPDGERACSVGVRDGRIAVVAAYDDPPVGDVVDLADDEVLLPGLVDAHVHVNEPGRTDWEGFDSATRAAARGGVTTLVDMPLNSIPPTVDVPALQAKRAAATGKVHVDVGFWGGVVPGNLRDLAGLHGAGVFGFKCFTAPSGVDEFPHVDARQLEQALAEVARLGSVLLVHAEDPEVLEASAQLPPGTSPRDFAGFLATRPASAEDRAVEQVVAASRRTRGRAHVVHLASASAVPVLAAAQSEGLPVTAETCPHYLALDAAQVPEGATEFKCCPPVRDAANRDALWDALRAGTVGCVVSDHSPCPPAMKHRDSGDFTAAWGGIASVQLGLPVVWTAARRRGQALTDVVRWMASAPAERLGLAGRKGSLQVGADADLCAFAPDEQQTVDPSALAHRHPVTPYAGARLCGVVRRTWLRGRPVTGDDPHGELLVGGGAP
ncbi:MAG TPA: allantoinase AllB [Actinomycetales bacterium]|nr:allantoinase AllB [Actinomycetales bacterium]